MEDILFFRDNVLPDPLKPKHNGLWLIKVEGDSNNPKDTFKFSMVREEEEIPLYTPSLQEVTEVGQTTDKFIKIENGDFSSKLENKHLEVKGPLEEAKYHSEYIKTEKGSYRPILLKFPRRDFSNQYLDPNSQEELYMPVMINGKKANSRGEVEIDLGASNFVDSNTIRKATNSFVRKALTGDVEAADNSNITSIVDGAVTTDKIADKAVTLDKLSTSGVSTGDIIIRTANGWEYISYQAGNSGDMTKVVYDPTGRNTDAFDYNNFYNTPLIPNISGKEDKANKKTNLNNPNNTDYPTTEAVNNAIQQAGGGDMMKATYDPLGKNADAFDYNNLENTPIIPDITVKADKITKVEGTGYLEGGGTLEADRTIDLTSAAKADIQKGIDAHSWGDHSQAGYLTSHQDITGKEDNINKATSLSNPNHTKYPTTQAVADALNNFSVSSLSKEEIEDETSTVFGITSGLRWFQAFTKHITDWWSNVIIEITDVNGLEEELENKQFSYDINFNLIPEHNKATIFNNGKMCTVNVNVHTYQDAFTVAMKNKSSDTLGNILLIGETGWNYMINDTPMEALTTGNNAMITLFEGGVATIIKEKGTQNIYIDGDVE